MSNAVVERLTAVLSALVCGSSVVRVGPYRCMLHLVVLDRPLPLGVIAYYSSCDQQGAYRVGLWSPSRMPQPMNTSGDEPSPVWKPTDCTQPSYTGAHVKSISSPCKHLIAGLCGARLESPWGEQLQT